MKDKRRIVSNILLITGLLLLLGAGGLYFYNLSESNDYEQEAVKLITRVKSEIPLVENREKDTPIIQSTLETKLIEGDNYDGYLTIPAINLEMAVYDTWNDSYLRKSICRYYGSPYTHDLIIAGHNYKTGFGKLRELKPGDEVFFTDMGGNTIKYEVKQTEVIDGTDINGMMSGGWDLSLYTCTYGGEARFTVRCSQN
jgi:sortase A